LVGASVATSQKGFSNKYATCPKKKPFTVWLLTIAKIRHLVKLTQNISFLWCFSKNREYCNKIFLKENQNIEKFCTNKKVLLMSLHCVRNINLFSPQMNQSKEIHF
jgi:hypothetical protein